MIFIAVFIAAICLPGLRTIVTHQGNLSSTEKRLLEQLPNWPHSFEQAESFPKKLDDYFKDNFGFRNQLLDVYYEFKYWLKDATGSDVIYGTEPGWLFYNNKSTDPIGDYRNINQFSAENLAQFIDYLKFKQQWLADKNIAYLFVLTPSKPYIYPEFLPKHLTRLTQNNVKTQLANALASQPEINYLDLTDVMLQNKNQQLLYFKADTHWNYFAGNLAQFEIIKTINQIMKTTFNAYLYKPTEFNFQWHHQGDLAFLLKAGEHFKEPLFKPDFNQCTEIDYMLSLSADSEYKTLCEGGKLNVLIFHDSFFNLIQN